jgi:hypothetical protein
MSVRAPLARTALAAALAAAAGTAPAAARAQDAGRAAPRADDGPDLDPRVEVCAVALAAVLRGLARDAGPVHVVPGWRTPDGALAEPDLVRRAAARAEALARHAVRLAEPAPDGGWLRPPGRLLFALEAPRLGPGARLAWLTMDVTGDDGLPRRLRFSLKRTDRGWVPLEWGPAEDES